MGKVPYPASEIIYANFPPLDISDVVPEGGFSLARKVHIQLLDYNFHVELGTVVHLPLGSAAMLASLLHKKRIDGFILRLVPWCRCRLPSWCNGRFDKDVGPPFNRVP